MERLNAMVKTTDVQAHFRALNPDYFGIVDAMLTASWETSPDGIHSMDERLDAAMALAAALEQADGAAWQTFADHHDFVFTQGPSGWLLMREDDHCTHRIHHHPGQRSSTQFETSPRLASAWPEGLWIQPTCDDAPNTRTGNPILDQFVSIQCLDPEAARRMGSAELTPAILALVSGHGGHVVDGQIHVYRSDLVVDPTEILTDITTLALALCAATESG